MSINIISLKLILLWIALSLIWSTSYLAIKVGVEGFSPLHLVSMRMLIGSVLLYIFMRYRSTKLSFDRHSLSTYLVSGIMGSALPFALISFGELQVDSSLSALLMGTAPVVTVLLAPMVHLDEKLSRSMLMGISAGVLGLIFLFAPAVLASTGGALIGQLAIFSAALCYAFTTLYVRKYANLPALCMATGSMIVGTIVICGTTLILAGTAELAIPSAKPLIAVIYLGIFPTALATLIYFYLLPKIGAARISQVNFAVPVFGAFFGVVFLGEQLAANMFLGLFAILIAVYLVSKK